MVWEVVNWKFYIKFGLRLEMFLKFLEEVNVEFLKGYMF